ncbi:hypothetical protein CEXT_782031 [Caerostris extrusa]|uniref:Uncharacterized protein n=1 Tax=Caerostris extrusa TaxID=172846 RepID=A0AAV4VDS6_CAEEX|nr:hypothetical protein CEXT_782031 [Caerostris extrusa]
MSFRFKRNRSGYFINSTGCLVLRGTKTLSDECFVQNTPLKSSLKSNLCFINKMCKLSTLQRSRFRSGLPHLNLIAEFARPCDDNGV